jgi:hypothetical protein
MAYSSFLVARGLAAVFFGAGLSDDASASDAFARVVVFFAAGFGVVVSAFVPAFAAACVSALPFGSALAVAFAPDFASAFAVASAGFRPAVFDPDVEASAFFAGVFD